MAYDNDWKTEFDPRTGRLEPRRAMPVNGAQAPVIVRPAAPPAPAAGKTVSELDKIAEEYLSLYACSSCWSDDARCTCESDKAAVREFVEHLKACGVTAPAPAEAYCVSCDELHDIKHPCVHLQVGQTYIMWNYRFGSAIVTVTGIPDATWVDIRVVQGLLEGMTDTWGPGDTKRVRREHCRFRPNAPAPGPGKEGT